MCQKYGRYMVAFAVGVALTAAAETTYTWTNARGDGDWANPANFIEGAVQTPSGAEDPATVCPGADDQVYIPVNTTIVLEYDTSDPVKKASCEAFAAVKSIRPYAGAVIDVTVPGDTAFPLACSLARGVSESNYNMGHLVKRGAGELVLNAAGIINANSSKYQEYYDYYCEMTVDAGVVRVLPEALTAHIHLGKVTINENGTLFTANTSGNGSESYTMFKYLYGSGTITNDYTSSCRMRVDKYGDFSGRITGSIAYYSGGRLRLTGTESTFPSITIYQNYGNGVGSEGNGSIEVAKFGTKAVDGVKVPSSIGYGETILVRDNAAAILYLGNGETTDKDVRFWPQQTTYPLFLDGGAHGGLVWTGLWGHRDTTTSYEYKMKRLILQGSNTQECVMSGVIESRICKDTPGTNYTFCITKQGTGTWRMVHNDASRMHGVWRVVDGTLRYDTIAEAGKNSALGSSTMLYKNLSGVLALDENKVDYAFWLGGGTSGNRANLEYVGETNCVSTTRRFAVNGTGGILNNGGGFLRLSDFYATNTASTLILGGTNTLDNVADEIADGGNATMSVTKEGSGTWRLGSNCTFTGALNVKSGQLVVGNPEKYEYYRWVIRANYTSGSADSTTANRTVAIKSFGLFDSEGNDRVYGLSDDGNWQTYSDKTWYYGFAYAYETPFFANSVMKRLSLEPGHFVVTAYDGERMAVSFVYNTAVSDIFYHTDVAQRCDIRRPSQSQPKYETTNTWLTITMRPVDGAPITSWDYVNAQYNANNQFVSNCVLEASVDGRVWTKLDEVTNDTKPANGEWQSDGTTYVAGYTTHTTGMPIPPGPTNAVVFAASSVSVAAGAELIARTPEKPVIHALTVDGLAGGGTIDGFAFASDLTLTIDNVASAAGLTIPMTLRNVEGLDASGWTVSVGDKVKASLHVSASSSGLTITPTGMQFLIR